MDKVTEKLFKDYSKEDIIKSRQHFMDAHVDVSNELYRVKSLVKNRIEEYEKIEKSFENTELTNFNVMVKINIQHELVFLRSLI